MDHLSANLRKAAVFIRSLDGETASTLLGQLSPVEATALRDAIRSLGAIDPEEQADVIAAFRRAKPLATQAPSDGVELELSTINEQLHHADPSTTPTVSAHAKRFEFLERAPIEVLVPYLSREHAQTIAVVMSHLPPRRAADVLAAFPEKLQAETIERLSVLGETDPESVVVLESELSAWLAKRMTGKPGKLPSNSVIESILSSTDGLTRSEIVNNLRARNAALASQFAPAATRRVDRVSRTKNLSDQAAACAVSVARSGREPPRRPIPKTSPVEQTPRPLPPRAKQRQHVDFEELIQLDHRTLAAVLSQVDSHVLVLALTGASDGLVDRICGQMSSRNARSIRRQLRKLGPTRLSDVASAQHSIAEIATRQLVAGPAGKFPVLA
jgi:flagellar motor switch protein FliG